MTFTKESQISAEFGCLETFLTFYCYKIVQLPVGGFLKLRILTIDSTRLGIKNDWKEDKCGRNINHVILSEQHENE